MHNSLFIDLKRGIAHQNKTYRAHSHYKPKKTKPILKITNLSFVWIIVHDKVYRSQMIIIIVSFNR